MHGSLGQLDQASGGALTRLEASEDLPKKRRKDPDAARTARRRRRAFWLSAWASPRNSTARPTSRPPGGRQGPAPIARPLGPLPAGRDRRPGPRPGLENCARPHSALAHADYIYSATKKPKHDAAPATERSASRRPTAPLPSSSWPRRSAPASSAAATWPMHRPTSAPRFTWPKRPGRSRPNTRV
jgi:hypothetical protein